MSPLWRKIHKTYGFGELWIINNTMACLWNKYKGKMNWKLNVIEKEVNFYKDNIPYQYGLVYWLNCKGEQIRIVF